MTLLLLFGLLAVFIVLEMPVAFAMGLSAIATIVLTQPIPLSIVVQRMGTGLDSFVLIAIPLGTIAAFGWSVYALSVLAFPGAWSAFVGIGPGDGSFVIVAVGLPAMVVATTIDLALSRAKNA